MVRTRSSTAPSSSSASAPTTKRKAAETVNDAPDILDAASAVASKKRKIGRISVDKKSKGQHNKALPALERETEQKLADKAVGAEGRSSVDVPSSSPAPKPRPTRGAGRAIAESEAKALSVEAKPKSKSTTKASSKATAREVTPDGPKYWLMKAEPNTRIENGVDVKFSIDDLEAATEPEPWEGVRNYVARNNMMAMKTGEYAFFYHSNCKVPGIAGIMEVVRESCVDESAFDPQHPYHDPKSSRDKPRWFMVHVAFKRKFTELVTLKQLQALGGPDTALQDMQLLKQSRLSVSKISADEWAFVMELVETREMGQAEKSAET